jgi:hypothetical protein
MKPYFNALLAPVLALSITVPIAQAANAETAKTIIDTSLYAEPFDDAKSVAKAKRDTFVSVTQRRLAWIKVKLGNTEGWVKSTALRIQGANILPTSTLASQNTGRNTQGNQIITTAVRSVHNLRSNRYVVIISDTKTSASSSRVVSPASASLNTRAYLTQLWGANTTYEWLIDSSSADQTQQNQDLSAVALKPRTDSVLIYINTPIIQKNDCSFGFYHQTSASSALSTWMNQAAQISQQMAQTWVLIEPIQTQTSCPTSLINSGANIINPIAQALNINNLAQDKTNISWLVASNAPQQNAANTVPITSTPANTVSKAPAKKIPLTKKTAIKKPLKQTKQIQPPKKTAQSKPTPAALAVNTNPLPPRVWLSYLSNCQTASTDLNQSGLISQTELASCVQQQANLANEPKLVFWQAGFGNISPYQVLNLSSKPIQLSLLGNDPSQQTPQIRALFSEIMPLLKPTNTNITQLRSNVITKTVDATELIYIWGVSAQNELTLLFPNSQDSANQLDKNSVFEWKLPADISVDSYPTVLATWVKAPLDFSNLSAEPKGFYFVFANTTSQWNTWLNLILNNQNEFTQLR